MYYVKTTFRGEEAILIKVNETENDTHLKNIRRIVGEEKYKELIDEMVGTTVYFRTGRNNKEYYESVWKDFSDGMPLFEVVSKYKVSRRHVNYLYYQRYRRGIEIGGIKYDKDKEIVEDNE